MTSKHLVFFTNKYISELFSTKHLISDINPKNAYCCYHLFLMILCNNCFYCNVVFCRGASPYDVTRRKCSPLFYACTARRAENADLLLKRAKTGIYQSLLIQAFLVSLSTSAVAAATNIHSG